MPPQTAPAPSPAPTINPWDNAPLAEQNPWDNAPLVGPLNAAPKQRRASGLLEAFEAGYQDSALGYVARNQLPSVVIDAQDSEWYEQFAAAAAKMLSDVPYNIAGAIPGAVGGGAVGTATGGPVYGTAIGAAIGGAGGAMALPAGIREGYIQALTKGQVKDVGDFLTRTAAVSNAVTKDFTIGAATAGAGKLAGVVTASSKPLVKTAAELAAEGFTLASVPAFFEGRLPEPQEFLNAAIMLVGLKGATEVGGRLMTVFSKTGKTPIEVVGDARRDPTIAEDLARDTPAAEPEISLKGMGQAISQNFYDGWFDTLAGGPNKSSAFKAEPLFAKTKEAFDQGSIKSADDLKNFLLAEQAKTNPTARPAEQPAAAAAAEPTPRPAGQATAEGPAPAAKPAEQPATAEAPDYAKAAESARPGQQLELYPDIPRAYKDIARQETVRNVLGDNTEIKIADLAANPYGTITPAKEPNHINYRYVDGPDDVKQVQAALAEKFAAEIAARRGTESWGETQQLASQLLKDRDPKDLLGKDLDQLAAETMAQQALAQKAAFDVAKAAADVRAAGPNPSPALIARQAEAIETAAMLHAIDQGNGAAIARALNARKAAREINALNEDAANLLQKYREDPAELARQIGELENTAQLNRFAAKASQVSVWDKLAELYKAALVSGVVTQTANIMGNATFLATRPIVDLAAVGFSLARSNADRVTAAEPLARVIGNVHGVLEGAKASLAVLRSGVAYGAAPDSYRPLISGKKGEVIRIPFRVLQAGDAFFKVVNERGELYVQATRQAVNEGYNPATREFRERVAQVADNPSEAMALKAQEAGERLTFNSRLDKASRSVQNVLTQVPVLKFFVPFVQTPINVTKEMLRLTPAAPIVPEWRAAIQAGGAERDKALAEIAVGTAVGATVFVFAMAGNITGQGDPDPNKRRTQMASGWQPYSIKLGDTYYSYQRLAPVGTLMGMAADAATLWDKMSPDEQDKIPKMLATAFANAITSQTFLQGITNIVGVFNKPEENAGNFFENFVSSWVPGALGQTAAIIDPYQREVYSILDAVKSRIPGLRETLEVKRDPYGEPVPGKKRPLGIVPVTVTEQSEDKVRMEVARLGVGVAPAPDYIELPAARDSKLGKVPLTPEKRDVFADKAGKFAYEILTQVVNSPSWDQTPDMVQRNMIKTVFERTRKAGEAAAFTPEEIQREAIRISTELQKRLQPK